ncbi:hypothetical protein QIA36_05280 (plasmid) [Borreliella yangtzensis]|uniref:hypothetical protein n=1 Tax=Borreliella yangtzensis TaxID=683292 RepID=UPI003B9F3031
MAVEKLRMPTGAVLVTVNIDKFKWTFKGSEIKDNDEANGAEPNDLVVKDLSSSIRLANGNQLANAFLG